MKTRTYELLGLAIAGTALGFLLPYWIPDVIGSIGGQAVSVVRIVGGLTLSQYVGVIFWIGTLLVVKGFRLRAGKRRAEGGWR